MRDDVQVGDGGFYGYPIDIGAGGAIEGRDEGFPTTQSLIFEMCGQGRVALEGGNDGGGGPGCYGEIETEADFGGIAGGNGEGGV